MSSMTPLKSAKGPSMTRMVSPTSQSGLNRGAFFSSSLRTPRMRSTSRRDNGVGFVPDPTKPVTPGVLRTTPHESSLRYILTRMYPGDCLRGAVTLRPALISTTSSMGITTSKIDSSMCIDLMRVPRLAFTLFSYPLYEWTTYQEPGRSYGLAGGSAGSASASSSSATATAVALVTGIGAAAAATSTGGAGGGVTVAGGSSSGGATMAPSSAAARTNGLSGSTTGSTSPSTSRSVIAAPAV